jgi:hypothetical protein
MTDSRPTALLVLPPIEKLDRERALAWLENDGPQLLGLVITGYGIPGPRQPFMNLANDLARMLEVCAQALRSGAPVRVERMHEPEGDGGVGDFEGGIDDLERLIAAVYRMDHSDQRTPVMAILAQELGARRAMIEATREREGGA